MILINHRWCSRFLFGLVASASVSIATGSVEAAEVFKCTNASGKVEFTDAPCGAKQTSAVVDARPNSLDNSAVREQLLKIENKALQDKLAAALPAPATSMQGQTDFARSDTPACRSAKRDVEAAATSVENNRALIRVRQSAMYIACGVREPDRQTTNIDVGHGGQREERPRLDPRTSTR